jgi:adenylosuccinate lyase
MQENLDAGGGLVYSQGVLLALVDAGLSRDDAYVIVQAAAAKAWDEGASFRTSIAQDPQVREAVDGDTVAGLFDPLRYLRNLDGVFDRLEKLEVNG